MYILLALSVIFLSAQSEQIFPIPQTPLGVSIGSSNPLVHIEAFYDLASPDSQQSYVYLMYIINTYNLTTKPFRLTTYITAQPAYYFSFLLSTGNSYIMNNCNNTADVWNYYTLIFNNSPNFTDAFTVTKSLNQMEIELATLISQNMPNYSYENVLKGIQDNENINAADLNAAYARYRGIAVAPSYFANGVLIDGAEQFGGLAWTAFLQNFISIP